MALWAVSFLSLLVLWAIGMGCSWHRIDGLTGENTRLSKDNQRLTARAVKAEQTAQQWEDHARDLAALADERAAELSNHRHRCLGVLVPNDSGVIQ